MTFGAGTTGVLVPFIAAIEPTRPWLAPYGYLALALAAAVYGGNELFGGTRSHIRFVTTQYRLERSLELLAIDWQSWQLSLDTPGSTSWGRMVHRARCKRHVRRAFHLLRTKTTELHAVISDETSEWATKLEAAEAAYNSRLSAVKKKD